MNSVERVKSLCKERKIPISRLEKDLGFSNGYIGQLRKGVFPDDRLVQIAEYLSVSVEYLISGTDSKNEKTPILTKKDERDIARDVERMMEDLSGSGELMFDGVPMSEEAKAAMAAAMRIGFEEARRRNKATYTPKKYREE
ncbi:MAG: helix-turn-helix transcriptional regulator [Oscillospiraceae bacterium]|nr:helix-turn-helix transcriptional regulator [Oscillospiraceae bacterium]